MTAAEVILHRRSVRTFDGNPVRPEDLKCLLDFANSVENPYSLPISWRALDAREHGLSSPVIVGADTYIAGKLRRAPHAEEAFGYAFERVVLRAEELGMGTTWIAGTMNRPAFERAMELQPDEVMPCVSPLGYPAKKMSARETLMRIGVKADSRLDFGELFYGGDFSSPLTPQTAGEFREALELVRRAPSAVNKQPWRAVLIGRTAHFYEKQSKGYVDSRGWDLQKVDVGIALCHFAMALEAAGVRARFETADPGLAAPGDTRYIASFVCD